MIKTVAAFAVLTAAAFSMGWTMMKRLELDPDYNSLTTPDRDSFELHLRNLLRQQFGPTFVTSKVAITFHAIEGKDVCQLEALPVKEPLIVTTKDKNGQTVEKFYARSGNSSQEIPLSEMSAYMKERFHS
jgi:hypothetical protein